MRLNEYIIHNPSETNNVYFLASDENGCRCILLKSSDSYAPQRLKTDCMTLKTNVDMTDENQNSIGKYHVIQCISQDIEINSTFIRVCNYLFSAVTQMIDTSYIIRLLQDLQTIFETSADNNAHGLQIGVCGEMLLLKYLRQNGRDDIADKWHSDFYTKHDIEINSNYKIEIKTTGSERRIHSFKHNQIVSNNKVTVASVMIEECEQGNYLYDLMIEMQKAFEDLSKKILIERLMRRCSISEESKGIIFDEKYSFEKIKFYNATDIPHIEAAIPPGVTNVNYEVNLDSNIPEIYVSDL